MRSRRVARLPGEVRGGGRRWREECGYLVWVRVRRSVSDRVSDRLRVTVVRTMLRREASLLRTSGALLVVRPLVRYEHEVGVRQCHL